ARLRRDHARGHGQLLLQPAVVLVAKDGHRRPRAATRVEPRRRPRTAAPVDPSRNHPIWRFSSVDLDGPFGWRRPRRGRVVPGDGTTARVGYPARAMLHAPVVGPGASRLPVRAPEHVTGAAARARALGRAIARPDQAGAGRPHVGPTLS